MDHIKKVLSNSAFNVDIEKMADHNLFALQGMFIFNFFLVSHLGLRTGSG